MPQFTTKNTITVGLKHGSSIQSDPVCRDLRYQKTNVYGLSCGAVCVILRLAVAVEQRLVSDSHTTMTHNALAWRRAVKIGTNRSGERPERSTARVACIRPPKVKYFLKFSRRGVAVTSLGVSTRLLYVGPGCEEEVC